MLFISVSFATVVTVVVAAVDFSLLLLLLRLPNTERDGDLDAAYCV